MWHEKVDWLPWLDPLPTLVACTTLRFILLTTFALSVSRPIEELPYWFVLVIGWAVTFLGIVWWLRLWFVLWKGRWDLVVQRVPYIEIDHQGEPIQKAEFVEHERIPVMGSVRKRHGQGR